MYINLNNYIYYRVYINAVLGLLTQDLPATLGSSVSNSDSSV